jgi:hypothetical protein
MRPIINYLGVIIVFNEEGIVNKLVTAAVIGLLGWTVMTTQQLAIDVAVISEKVDTSIRQQVSSSDIAILQDKIVRLENWNQNLSTRLANVEDYIRKEDL